MNKLKAMVSQIEGEQNLHIIRFKFQEESLSMMGLELPSGLKVGSCVILGVKPSQVAIGKEIRGELSYSNQLSATIVSIENGTLLSALSLDVKGETMQSFITLSSSKRMQLKPNDRVTLLIKASDLFILEVCDA